MELLKTGHVAGTFGLAGSIKVVSSSGEYEHFVKLKRVYVEFFKNKLKKSKYQDGWFDVEDVRVTSACALFTLKGVDALEDAKCFVGGDFFVERQDACLLKEGEFYSSDISSCCLFYQGDKVAEILDVAEVGCNSLLEVKKCDGICCFVPFNAEFIGDVDIERGMVELRHDWILG